MVSVADISGLQVATGLKMEGGGHRVPVLGLGHAVIIPRVPGGLHEGKQKQ